MPVVKKKSPRFMGWGITQQCNLACPHCYSSAASKHPDELSVPECRAVIDALSELGVETIGWTGGEPLMRKDLEETIAYAGDRGISSAITTNGVLLTAKRARQLKEVGVESIQVSLDGSTPERNAMMRQATGRQFERVISGIRSSQQMGFRVHLAMLLGQANLEDARDFVALARDLGVSSVRFCAFVPKGRGSATTIKEKLSFSDRLNDLKILVEGLRGSVDPVILFDPAFGPLPPDYQFHPCIAGTETFYLAPNGDVFPCTSLIDDEFTVGNVRQRSLFSLWNDSRMAPLRSHGGRDVTGYCRTCRHFHGCRGACRGITFAHTGSHSASFPVCLSRVQSETPVATTNTRR